MLLDAEPVQRPAAEGADAVRLAGLQQQVKQKAVVVGRNPDLVAQAARIADPADQSRHGAERHAAHIHETECPGGNILILADKRRQHVARLRPGYREPVQAGPERRDRDRPVGRQMPGEPAHMVLLGRAGADQPPEPATEIGERKVADELAALVQHRREAHAPHARQTARQNPVEPDFRARPRHVICGEAAGLRNADALPHGPALRAHMLEVRGTAEREPVLDAGRREPERLLQPPGVAEHRAHTRHPVVDRRGAERARRRQFLVREADRETPGIILAHFGVGIGGRRPGAVAGDIHGVNVETGVAVHDPVGEREADAAALAEPRHHRAGAPEARQPAHRPDEWIAVRREAERTVDDPLDAGLLEGREMLEPDFQRGRDTVEVRLQQFVAEIPGRADRRPGPARLLIGPHQHAAAFLAQVDFALEVHDMQHLAARLAVVCLHFRHVVGDEIHVLHCQDRQFEADHAPDLARPEPARIDNVRGPDFPLVRPHQPIAAGKRLKRLDLGEAVYLGPLFARCSGIGVGRAGRVHMAVIGIPERPHKMPGVEQRHVPVRLLGGDDFRIEPEIASARMRQLEPLHALRRAGQQVAARHMQPRRLARCGLDLRVEIDGVFLQPGDMRVAIDGVHAAGGMPARPAGEFVALDQHDILPAALRQVIQHRSTDHPAADNDDFGMSLHATSLPASLARSSAKAASRSMSCARSACTDGKSGLRRRVSSSI